MSKETHKNRPALLVEALRTEGDIKAQVSKLETLHGKLLEAADEEVSAFKKQTFQRQAQEIEEAIGAIRFNRVGNTLSARLPVHKAGEVPAAPLPMMLNTDPVSVGAVAKLKKGKRWNSMGIPSPFQAPPQSLARHLAQFGVLWSDLKLGRSGDYFSENAIDPLLSLLKQATFPKAPKGSRWKTENGNPVFQANGLKVSLHKPDNSGPYRVLSVTVDRVAEDGAHRSSSGAIRHSVAAVLAASTAR